MVSLESLVEWLVCEVNIQGPSLHGDVKETAMLAAHWQTMTPNVFQSLVGNCGVVQRENQRRRTSWTVSWYLDLEACPPFGDR